MIELVTEIPIDRANSKMDEGIAAPAVLNILDNAVDACVEDRGKSVHRIVFAPGETGAA
jgi:hypothetical protein